MPFTLKSMDGIWDDEYLTTDDPPAGTSLPAETPRPYLQPSHEGQFMFPPIGNDSLSNTNAPRLFLDPELPQWAASGIAAAGPLSSLEPAAVAGVPAMVTKPDWKFWAIAGLAAWYLFGLKKPRSR